MAHTPPETVAPGEPWASPSRVDLTGVAADLLRRLTGIHGPLMFHQSGGCCDGSSPMCFPAGDFITSEADVHLADLAVDGPEGVRFLIRSRLLTAEELTAFGITARTVGRVG